MAKYVLDIDNIAPVPWTGACRTRKIKNALQQEKWLDRGKAWEKINAWNNSNCGTKYYPFRDGC